MRQLLRFSTSVELCGAVWASPSGKIDGTLVKLKEETCVHITCPFQGSRVASQKYLRSQVFLQLPCSESTQTWKIHHLQIISWEYHRCSKEIHRFSVYVGLPQTKCAFLKVCRSAILCVNWSCLGLASTTLSSDKQSMPAKERSVGYQSLTT